jgi:hypothetical protein
MEIQMKNEGRFDPNLHHLLSSEVNTLVSGNANVGADYSDPATSKRTQEPCNAFPWEALYTELESSATSTSTSPIAGV